MKRDWLARLPLPMLALAAAYGVFEYNRLFVPMWVAFVSAAAFELTYVALAFTATNDPRRATAVSLAAVIVSVLYNVLAALFVRRPALLVDTPLWGDVLLATLHGAPLAIVAYNVAALLFHRESEVKRVADSAALSTMLATPVQAQQLTVNIEAPAPVSDAQPLSKSAKVRRLAEVRDISESAAWRLVRRQPDVLEEVM
jgi:4-amino-4-deoxy-L-arabinose transferase-like glycosyltransferase